MVMVSSGCSEICDMNRAKSLDGRNSPFSSAPALGHAGQLGGIWWTKHLVERKSKIKTSKTLRLTMVDAQKSSILTYALDHTGMYVLGCLGQRKFS